MRETRRTLGRAAAVGLALAAAVGAAVAAAVGAAVGAGVAVVEEHADAINMTTLATDKTRARIQKPPPMRSNAAQGAATEW